jgi:hypothetical protein
VKKWLWGLVVLTLGCVFFQNAFSQIQVLPTQAQTWSRSYGGDSGDHKSADFFNSVDQTTDGGFIVAGDTTSFGEGGFDAWVMKLNASGNVEWQKTYGSTDDDWWPSIQQTTDGGYIVAGDTCPIGGGDSDAWILKLDASGSVEWQKFYKGGSSETAESIQQTTDAGF